ncbi:hypothetical protein [Sphingomonas sp. BAUL-RG-20F-R05-02]|uniref:hypothetical protein n=1 Tax=Sphingomonas sp. BAUL-RG-20F-R05-02 TaxID=2914830 RepID=UPI001F5ABB99|nr:hypothetical protein [Sphingomonas sp. BAUL-RG-20F-R05-02]
MPRWQVPQPAYRQMQVSIAALGADLRPISPFARWLYEQFTTTPSFVTLGDLAARQQSAGAAVGDLDGEQPLCRSSSAADR